LEPLSWHNKESNLIILNPITHIGRECRILSQGCEDKTLGEKIMI
jgi:hypothetical protein